MLQDRTIAVIGLGLIGGSLARDLAALGIRVLAFDADPETLAAALSAAAVQQALSGDLTELAEADVVVLAVPVTEVPRVLARASTHIPSDALVTDVGSTKRSIAKAAASLGLESQFVGGHPLAGDNRGGWNASRTGLFSGARVFLSPARAAKTGLIERAAALWRALGAEPVITTAEAHDRLLARVSHLPQAVAYLLAGMLARDGVERQNLGPGGRDTLRLAASPAELWTGIALDNADELGAALAELRAGIDQLEAALRSGDAARLYDLFESGRRWYAGG